MAGKNSGINLTGLLKKILALPGLGRVRLSSIEMTTAPGLTYQLEYKNDLTDATWTPLPPPLPAGATTLILTDSNSPATKRFYRIQAQ